MREWIKHDGKSRPDLPPGTRVSVRMSNGWTDETYRAHPSWEFWDEEEDEDNAWIGPKDDDIYIIAYKVVQK